MTLSFRNNVEASAASPHTVTATMLLTKAAQVVQHVFDLRGIAQHAREQTLLSLYERMDSFEIRPLENNQVDPIIRQSKVAIEEKLTEHTDASLQQAVHVRFVYDKHLRLLNTPRAEASYEQYLQDMVASLMLANRHMAMLEALENIKNKIYIVRASAGGNSKKNAPSTKTTSQLLEAMIKGMIYNNAKLVKRDKTDVADEIATRIFKVNREFEMLDIANLDDLKHKVRNILFEISRTCKQGDQRKADRLQLGHSLRHSFPNRNTEEERHMDVEAARTFGRIEGIKVALIQQVKQRFGELPTSVIETLEAADDLDQLQTYLERLTEARTLGDVFQNSQ